MKKYFSILYPGIPPLRQAHPTQCILEESKMSLHLLNLHLGFGSLQVWVQPSKHVSKAYVTHKPCCPYVKKQGIRLAVTEMCKLTCGWRETPQLWHQTLHMTGTASPPCPALWNLSLQATNVPKASETLDPSSMDQNTRSWLHARTQGLWVYCVLAYISRENILHLASDAKLLQLWENSNSPRSKYSFNFLSLEMILRICSEWRQMKNATC